MRSQYGVWTHPTHAAKYASWMGHPRWWLSRPGKGMRGPRAIRHARPCRRTLKTSCCKATATQFCEIRGVFVVFPNSPRRLQSAWRYVSKDTAKKGPIKVSTLSRTGKPQAPCGARSLGFTCSCPSWATPGDCALCNEDVIWIRERSTYSRLPCPQWS